MKDLLQINLIKIIPTNKNRMMNRINLRSFPLRKKNNAKPKQENNNTIRFFLVKTKYNLINNSSKNGAMTRPSIIFFKYGKGICFTSSPNILISTFIITPKGISIRYKAPRRIKKSDHTIVMNDSLYLSFLVKSIKFSILTFS